jgi:hypothetical protein
LDCDPSRIAWQRAILEATRDVSHPKAFANAAAYHVNSISLRSANRERIAYIRSERFNVRFVLFG